MTSSELVAGSLSHRHGNCELIPARHRRPPRTGSPRPWLFAITGGPRRGPRSLAVVQSPPPEPSPLAHHVRSVLTLGQLDCLRFVNTNATIIAMTNAAV